MGLTGAELELILNTTNITMFIGVGHSSNEDVRFAALKHDARFSKGLFLTNDEHYAHLNGRLENSFGFKYGCSLDWLIRSIELAFRDIRYVGSLTLYDLV